MPDCFTAYGGSQYLNSPAVGNYDDYLVQELVPYIDRTYRKLFELCYAGDFPVFCNIIRHAGCKCWN
jgi:hypothetical protein